MPREDHPRQFCDPSDNPVEERCAVNLIISQRPVIFPRAGIFSLLKNANHCYHSSNWSNQSGVWNIKLEYIIQKGIILAKFTPTEATSVSPSPTRGSLPALLGTDNSRSTLSLSPSSFLARGNELSGHGFRGSLRKISSSLEKGAKIV